MLLKPIFSMILRDIDCIIERYWTEKEDERVVEKNRTRGVHYKYMCDVNKILFEGYLNLSEILFTSLLLF